MIYVIDQDIVVVALLLYALYFIYCNIVIGGETTKNLKQKVSNLFGESVHLSEQGRRTTMTKHLVNP